MEPLPLVSCIIPTKDRPDLVVRAVESALGQTHPRMEVIVVDDSTEGAAYRALAGYGQRIHYIQNETSRGAPFSRNVGMTKANGDVIAFLDDDDTWMPTKTETQLKLLEQSPLVGCFYMRRRGNRSRPIRLPEVIRYREMLHYNYLGSCSFAMVDRRALCDCAFDEGLASGQDWDMWIQIMNRNSLDQVRVVPNFLVEYNDGTHARISDPGLSMRRNLAILDKYKAEHDAESVRLFFLYNMFAADSLLGAFLRDYLKIRAKGRGAGFLVKILMERLLGRGSRIF